METTPDVLVEYPMLRCVFNWYHVFADNAPRLGTIPAVTVNLSQ